MDLNELLAKATDGITVRRVFGEPITVGDSVLIPVAWVMGGAGGGGGSGKQGSGSGGASGLRAGPVGLYQARNGVVTWHPALNINRVIAGGQALAGLTMLVLASRATLGKASTG